MNARTRSTSRPILTVAGFLTTLTSFILTTTLLASPAEAIKSECPTNRFCVWEEPSYEGRMQAIANTNSYQAIRLGTVRSYYNRRSDRTWLHEDVSGGQSRLCINPGASNSNVSVTWQKNAEAAYLSTATNC